MRKSDDWVTSLTITEFNKNISKHIRNAEKEVIYLERRGIPIVVMVSKQMFDAIMKGYLELKRLEDEFN